MQKLNDSFIDDRDAIISEGITYFDENLDFIQLKTDNKFVIPDISDEQIKKYVSEMSSNKSTGSDGVSAKFVKLFLDPMLPILKTIFNKSIKTGIFPIS